MRGGVLSWGIGMQLYLVRHTQLAVPPGVCYGQSNIDVADSFVCDLAAVRAKISDIVPAASFSSPLKRCRKLANHLNLQNLQLDNRLLELNFGAWEMQNWQDIPRQELDAWSQTFVDTPPPNGESFHDLYRRASDFVTELQTSYQNQNVLVITHAGVIRAMLALALHLSLIDVFKFELAYGGLTLLKFMPELVSVAYVNR